MSECDECPCTALAGGGQRIPVGPTLGLTSQTTRCGHGTLAVWAERTGRRQAADHGRGLLRFAFYGRVSTEDRQDPVMSLARQREQAVALVAVSARQESEKGGQTSSGSSRHGQGQPRVTMSHAQIQPIVGFSRVRGGT